MSSEVRFHLVFEKINEKAQSKWKKMSRVWEDDFAEKNLYHRDDIGKIFGNAFFVPDSNNKPLGLLWISNDEKISIEEMNTKEWNFENTGQDWTNINEWDETGFHAYSSCQRLVTTSTGSAYYEDSSFPPLKGIIWLLKQLEKYDKNLTSVINYECQDLEFTGIIVFKGVTQYCGFEYSKEEIVDMMIKEYPDQLSKKWDKEKKDWTDEDSEEFFEENVYCYIGDNIKYTYIEKLNLL